MEHRAPTRLLGLFVALGALAACSDSNDDAETSDDPTTTWRAYSPPDSGDGSPATGGDGISVAVYWTRPFGTARPIDVPGHRDPDGGPYPFVLYGAVTNVGDTGLDAPDVLVEWSDGTGADPLHRVTARPVDAQGRALASLAPGATADLVVVVDDPAIAPALSDAPATFGLAGA